MIRIIFALSILLFSNNLLQAQDCSIPQVLLDYYGDDVKQIALERMQKLNAPELSQIEISQNYQDTIMQGLAAIYNSDDCNKELIFNDYCIHHFNNYYAADRLYIKIDTTASWYKNWKNGTITTQIEEIDSLFAKYGFNEVRYSYPFINVFTIVSNRHLNLKPLINFLSTIPKVIYAEAIPNIGDGNKIRYEKINNIQYYTFVLAWGDCPSGCTIFHDWKYSVNENCEVTFVEESGSPITFNGTHCNISGTYTPVTISATNNNFCIGDSSILSVDRGEQFLWSTGETSPNITIGDAGKYSVTVTESNGCVKFASINILMPTPYIYFPKLDDTICYSNSPVDLLAYPNDGQFSINQVEINTSFIPSHLNVGANTISYTRVDTSSGCSNTVTQQIVISQDTVPIIGDTIICEGENSVLSVCDESNNTNYYQWNDGSTDCKIFADHEGQYSVNITQITGCIQYAQTTIKSVPNPKVSLHLPRDTFYLSENKVELMGGNPLGGTYIGNGIDQDYLTPKIAGLGTHNIFYSYEDTNHCKGQDSQFITIVNDTININQNLVNNNGINIMPVPAASYFLINGINQNIIQEILLYNISGKLVKSYAHHQKYDTYELPNGIYFLSIRTNNQNIIKKLVIEH